jgi:hypothetical protein
MGFFSKPAPAPEPEKSDEWTMHSTPDGDVLAPAGKAPRTKQAEAGGPVTRYRLVGRNDPELGFITPRGLTVVCEAGEFKIGDEADLTLAEHQVLSKNTVWVPVDAL